MEERLLRLKDFLESYLVSPARSPAEAAMESFLARYPFQHDGESTYDFNLRLNAYKTPGQILAEIVRSGVDDYYCEYRKVETQSYPSGDTYTQLVQEHRLLLRSRQLTEPVIVALLERQVPLQLVYEAMHENHQPSIFSKPIALAAARGSLDSLKTLAQLYLGGFRWDVHGHHFDKEVMISILDRLTRPQFLDTFEHNLRGKGFAAVLDECKQMIRAGLVSSRTAKAHVLEDDMGM